MTEDLLSDLAMKIIHLNSYFSMRRREGNENQEGGKRKKESNIAQRSSACKILCQE
jgi:hypothetical protein